MREKIFSEILKMYPSCHDLLSKRILTDKILNLPVDVFSFPSQLLRHQDEEARLQSGSHASVHKLSHEAAGGEFLKVQNPPDILQTENWFVFFIESGDQAHGLGS
jgi:hypothetical protein